jgi:hypothetical protein
MVPNRFRTLKILSEVLLLSQTPEGMKYEGIERQGERCNNQYFDLQVFSLLKTDL